jgi:hypothetical protein
MLGRLVIVVVGVILVCLGVLIPKRLEKTIFKSRETDRFVQWSSKIAFCAVGLYLIYKGFTHSK